MALAVRPQAGLEAEHHLQAGVLGGLAAGRHLHPNVLATGACLMQASACVVPVGGYDCRQRTCMLTGEHCTWQELQQGHFQGHFNTLLSSC